MEAGMFHKVVEYRIAQKVTRLKVDRYLNYPQVILKLIQLIQAKVFTSYGRKVLT